ncbi:MAG: DNA polymerase III subunit beta [Planctomycetota bacterium]
MRVVCDRGALLDAVNMVSSVAAARTPKPQLTCVKLTAETNSDGAGELTLAATDGEVGLRLQTARVDVQEAGSALVPADKLKQIVAAEDAEPTLTLETEDRTLTVRGEDANFTLLGYDPAELPRVPDRSDFGAETLRTRFDFPADLLRDMIAQTLFATARETTRYAINGLLMRRRGKVLELVATDGRRLALTRGTVPGAGKDDDDVSCIVPTKALSLLQRLVDGEDETVTVAVGDQRALFAIGISDDGQPRAVLSSTLVDGQFPPYEEAIPGDQNVKATFDRDVLHSAVKRAALLTNEESKGVRMAFSGEQKTLELSSHAPEMGEARVQVELKGYDGADVEIGFNPAFITEALRVLHDADVTMELRDGRHAGLIKSSGNGFLYVVMPVNI